MQYEAMWKTVTGESLFGNEVTHIVPLHDLLVHHLCADCWCHPDLDDIEDTATHHSADGRELFEMGFRKPS